MCTKNAAQMTWKKDWLYFYMTVGAYIEFFE